MQKVILEAEQRQIIGKQVKALRRQGKIPAILYGHSFTPTPISLNAREANLIIPRVTSSQIITINLAGEEFSALVRERQRHPTMGNLLHVDFQVVSMTERLRANVMLEIVGEAPAVKEYGGLIVTGVEILDIEALPLDLPERITVDISELREIGDSIFVRDIDLPSSVELFTDPDEIVVIVTAPAALVEEEEAKEELYPEAEPSVIERGKLEEEEF